MRQPPNVRLAAIALAAALVPLAAGAAGTAPRQRLSVQRAWSRPTPPGAPTAVGYMTIVNPGPTEDRLVGAASPAAASVEIHEMSMTGGVMRMRPLPDGLVVPAGGQIALRPGGYHLMLIGPTRPLKAGDRVAVTLRFQRAGPVPTVLAVGPEPQP